MFSFFFKQGWMCCVYEYFSTFVMQGGVFACMDWTFGSTKIAKQEDAFRARTLVLISSYPFFISPQLLVFNIQTLSILHNPVQKNQFIFFFLLTCVSVCICIVFCYLPKHLLKWWGCLVWSGHFWHHGRLYAGSRQLLQARNFYYPFYIIDQYRHHHLILVVSILKVIILTTMIYGTSSKNIGVFGLLFTLVGGGGTLGQNR